MCVGWFVSRAMDDIVHLIESSPCPSTQVPIDVDCNFPSGFEDDQVLPTFAPVPSRGGMHSRGTSISGRFASVFLPSEAPLSHKV